MELARSTVGLGNCENSGESECLGARRCRMKDKSAGVGSPEDAVPRLRGRESCKLRQMCVGEQSYHSHPTPVIESVHFPA